MIHQFMNTLETDTENSHKITVYDPTTIDWSKFTFPSGWFKHPLSIHDILKPYNISYAYYRDVIWEYVILAINGIVDIEEIPIGTEIKIPKLNDLNTFLLENKK